MKVDHKVGDLVHIPQSVELIDDGRGAADRIDDAQLTIPIRVAETQEPSIGVITEVSQYGYVRVYCNGTNWSVKNGNIYTLK